jgi:tryptophan-rich sensory protein
MTTGKSLLGLVGWLLISFSAAAMGALFMPGEWYAALNKPSWNPPSWLFGPVWTVLYTMMAVAAWLVWKRGGFAQQRLPLTAFLVQMVLNAAWSPLFFGAQQPALALVNILLLLAAIVWTMVEFFSVHRIATALLAPYLAWVSFATVLNATLWWMNR